jgi:hypothetical protein
MHGPPWADHAPKMNSTHGTLGRTDGARKYFSSLLEMLQGICTLRYDPLHLYNSRDRVGTYAEARIFSAFEPSWFVEREPPPCGSEPFDNSDITF